MQTSLDTTSPEITIEAVVKYITSKFLDFQLMNAFKEDSQFIEINFDYIEPALLFLSQQTSSVPFGALLGYLVGSKQYRLPEALMFLEAFLECGGTSFDCVNGNWIVHPIDLDVKANKLTGISTNQPILKTAKDSFCGKTLHNPRATRIDHLDFLNSIKFTVNTEFTAAYPNIPETSPYIKHLPSLLGDIGESSFMLDHKYDTRGRTYCASQINYQGIQYEKCLLQFAKKTKITEDGYENLNEYIDGLKDSEEYLKFTATQAYNSDKTGIFIGSDAHASGIQIMSVLFGCETSAESVGLTNKDNDFYTLADKYSELTVGEDEDSRQLFKDCCMQHFYGGVKTPRERLGEDNLPKFFATLEVLAPGCQQLLNDIQMCYWKTPVFNWTLPDGFLVQQPVISTMNIELELPNHPEIAFGYNFKSLNAKKSGLELAANVVHSVDGYIARELVYRASQGSDFFDNDFLVTKLKKAIKQAGNFDNYGSIFSMYKLMQTPSDKWSLLGKSFLHKAYDYLEMTKIREMEPFTVISIHDDFKCHPNYVLDMRWLYIELLAEIADSTLVKQIIEEVNPNITYNHEPSPTLANKLRIAYIKDTGKGLT